VPTSRADDPLTPRPRRGKFRLSALIVALIVVIATLLFAWPVAMIVVGAFRTGTPGLSGEWTLSEFIAAVTAPDTWTTFGNSVWFALVVTIGSKLLSLIFAWIVARTNTPLRGFVTPMMIIVLAVPTLFFGISWIMLGDEHSGTLNFLISGLFNADVNPINVESWPGLIFVTSLRSAAFGYFLLLGPFLALDRIQDEAASVAGAGRARIFLTVQLPAMGPAVLSVLILGFIIGLEYFELPLLLGTPAGIDVFSTQIYDYIYNTEPPQYARGSTLALILIVVLLIMLFIQARVLRGRSFTAVSGKRMVAKPMDLGGWKWVMCGLIVVYGLLAVVLPALQLFIGSLQPFLGVFTNLSLDNYATVLNDPAVMSALRLTGLLAVGGGLISVVLALCFAFVMRHFPGVAASYLRFITWLPWSIPGTALTLGMLWAYLMIPLTSWMYGTPWLMLIGLVVAATPVAMRSIEPAVGQIGRELEEAAWVSGASKGRAFAAITSRLVLPSFLSGWLLAGLLIAGNLAIPLMLGSVHSLTLPTVVYSYYRIGKVPLAAALFCILALAIALCFIVYWMISTAVGRRRRAGRGPTAGIDGAPLSFPTDPAIFPTDQAITPTEHGQGALSR